jgi:hypothetical protein
MKLSKSDEIVLCLAGTIHTLRKNAEAYDDDLADTWDEFMESWKVTKELIEEYIKEGER